MATDLQRLIVSLEAQTKQFTNALNKANGVADKRARAIESRFQRMNKNVSSSFANMLRSGVAIAGGALGVREVTQYADAWTEAGNKIRASAEIAGVQARSLSELNEIAAKTRSGITETADLYAKLIRSASGVAKSEMEVARATEIVNKAFKAGGAATSEQQAGILQLAQGLGSGTLQGDELRSIRENAPLLAQAIAKEFGTTIAGLKDLGAEGKLTTDRIFRAILSGGTEIEAAFQKTNATIGDGFTNLRNKLTEYIGVQAEAHGVTAAINGILGSLANNIDSVANAAAAAGVVLAATFGRGAAIAGVAALANPFVAIAAAIGAAAFALSAFGDEIMPIQGELANLQDYAAVIWGLMKDGAATAADTIIASFNTFTDLISSALGGVEVDFASLLDTAISAADGVLNAFNIAYDTLAATFSKLPAAVAESAINAVNTMIELVSAGIQKVVDGINTVIRAANSAAGIFGIDSPIGEVKFGGLEGVTNTFKGAGEEAAAAYADALKRGGETNIRDAIAGISAQIAGVGDEVRRRANARARDRAIINSEDARREALGAGNSSDGFGVSTSPPLIDSGGGGGKGKSNADKLRDAAKAAKELERAERDAQRAAEDMGGAIGDAVGGFVDALSDGKLEAKELLGILSSLARQLIRMGGGGGFAGGFLSSVLGAVFHDGGTVGGPSKMRAVSPGTFAGAKRYHRGGIAGLQPGEVPAILQKGETVIPRGGRMGGGQSIVIHAPINAPGADAAALARVERSVQELGKNIPKMVDQRTDARRTRGVRA